MLDCEFLFVHTFSILLFSFHPLYSYRYGEMHCGQFFFGWCFVRARARALDMHVRRGVFGGDAAIVKSM